MNRSKLIRTLFDLRSIACSQTKRFLTVNGMVVDRSHHKDWSKRHKKSAKQAVQGDHDEVLAHDVENLHRGNGIEPSENGTEDLPERFAELDINIKELSSTGDGLGVSGTTNHVYVVPFSLPGDTVKAKIIRHVSEQKYSVADFVSVSKAAGQRRDDLVKCPYFAKCGGCQFQMLSYDGQLAFKRTVIERAYKNFSTLTPEAVPVPVDAIGSPLQYGYRTKLTPHFDGPPGSMSRKARRDKSTQKAFETVPPIGFQMKGMRKTLDIEDCPIGTDAVREGLKAERQRVSEEISKYRKGATLLLRESTVRDYKDGALALQKAHEGPVSGDIQPDGHSNAFVERRTCVTDQKATATEYVDDFVFKNTAGAFFQNNNSILSAFTGYIRSHIIPSGSDQPGLEYLIDAYCGSGLFTVTLSSLFKNSIGIDVSDASTAAARQNAEANNIQNTKFIAADAAELFAQVEFPPERTAIVIDPPRKGCDEPFLRQLLQFGPQRVVYVSCNVHTQARDVGVLVEGRGDCRYNLESLQGLISFLRLLMSRALLY